MYYKFDEKIYKYDFFLQYPYHTETSFLYVIFHSLLQVWWKKWFLKTLFLIFSTTALPCWDFIFIYYFFILYCTFDEKIYNCENIGFAFLSTTSSTHWDFFSFSPNFFKRSSTFHEKTYNWTHCISSKFPFTMSTNSQDYLSILEQFLPILIYPFPCSWVMGADDTILSQFFSTKFSHFKIMCPYLEPVWNCITMSTHKPMFGPVVLDIVCDIFIHNTPTFNNI